MIKWIINYTLIALLIGACAWQFFMKDKALTQQVSAQQHALNDVIQTLQTFDQQFQEVAMHSNEIVKAITQLDQVVRGDALTWQLMQAQNLIEQAVISATLLNDTKASLNLFTAADNALSKIDNANLLAVRKALQQDIQMLSQQGSTHVSQVVLALQTLSEQVPNWPHIIKTPQSETAKPDTAQTDTQRIEHKLKSTWAELKSLIRIQRHDTPFKPYFSQDENWLINENMQLMLNQASFSALKHDQAVFHQAIEQSLKWLDNFFDTNNEAIQQAKTTLTELQKISVSTEASLAFKTIEAWNQFTKLMESAPADKQEAQAS